MTFINSKTATKWLFAFTLPLDFSGWTETSFPFESMPKFQKTVDGMSVLNDDSVGGFAFVAPQKHRKINKNSELSFEWKIDRFSPTQSSFPLTKKQDDYPIRIGLLLDTGESQIPLPSNLEKRLKTEAVRISRFVFFVPSQKATEVRCGQSPYSKRGLTCLTPANAKWTHTVTRPAEHIVKWVKSIHLDQSRVVGFWIFADSDNSKSKSKALFRNIKWDTK